MGHAAVNRIDEEELRPIAQDAQHDWLSKGTIPDQTNYKPGGTVCAALSAQMHAGALQLPAASPLSDATPVRRLSVTTSSNKYVGQLAP